MANGKIRPGAVSNCGLYHLCKKCMRKKVGIGFGQCKRCARMANHEEFQRCSLCAGIEGVCQLCLKALA